MVIFPQLDKNAIFMLVLAFFLIQIDAQMQGIVNFIISQNIKVNFFSGELGKL